MRIQEFRTMKTKLCSVVFLLIIFSSCNRYVAPVFTNVEQMSQLRPGISIKQTVDILQIEPYNIYDMQTDGSMILAFNYRLKVRRMAPPTFNKDEFNRQTTNEDSQVAGEEFYSKDYKTLYALYRDNKLVSFTTTDGMRKSEQILVHNNNQAIIAKENVTTLNNPTDSLSTATSIAFTHGVGSFNVSTDRNPKKEKESFFRRLFNN